MRPYGHAVLGGTFDHLHVGHSALLDTAFRAGRRVSIGLTTDRYLARSAKPFAERLQPFAVRRSVLHRWLRRHYPRRTWRTVPLEDRFGGSIEDGVDVLVVSEDTLAGGRAVNAERHRLGRRPVPIVTVPVVLADDLGPVSSRRIRSGAIDAVGHRRAPIAVAVRADDPRDLAPVRDAVRHAFSRASVEFLRTESVPPPDRDPAAPSSDPEEAAIVVTVRRRPAGGWEITERAGERTISAAPVPNGPTDLLRRATLGLLRPDLERKA